MQRTEHVYDTANRLTQQKWIIGSDKFGEAFTYDADDGSLATDSFSALNQTLGTVSYGYDALKRASSQITKTKTNNYVSRWFTYADDGTTNKGSTRVAQDVWRVGTQQNSGTVLHGQKYVYNTDGNIAEIQDLNGNPLAEYAYDALGQLTEETIYTSSESSYTYLYTYDNAGNLLSRRVSGTTVEDVYQYTNTYWADLLTSFKGQTINYETATVSINGQTVTLQSGNPENWYNNYDGNNHSYTIFTWAQGRQLVSLAKDSSTANIFYTYDMEGIRSSKTVGGVTHSYVTQNGKVVRERWNGSYTIWIIYDAGGKPFSMLYSYDGGVNWSTYYYILNLQGDVVKLVDASGNTAASYTYDAWGKPLTATGSMASINPLRYRGYYYDTETGWYYLQSRYYNPIVKRFINADAFASTGQGFLGYNMFAYCNNNPVILVDETGHFSLLNFNRLEADTGCSCGGGLIVTGLLLYLIYKYGDTIAEGIYSSFSRARDSISNKTKELSDSLKKRLNEPGYTVYFLKDKRGVVQYVGRTKDSNYEQRMKYHEHTKGLSENYAIHGLTYAQARGLEEIGMLECHTLAPIFNSVGNKIHGLGPYCPYGSYAMEQATGYIFNKAEQILLDILGW